MLSQKWATVESASHLVCCCLIRDTGYSHLLKLHRSKNETNSWNEKQTQDKKDLKTDPYNGNYLMTIAEIMQQKLQKRK